MLFTIGANGYLGRSIHTKAATYLNALGTSSNGTNGLLPFRLECPFEFNFDIINFGDTVFLTAAISAPDICASEYSRSWAVNVTGTIEFIKQVLSRGARVLFFSSDAVYGEHSEMFSEGAMENPSGEYAHMKAEVESFFQGNPSFKSIRLSYVFSRDDKFTRYLFDCAKLGEEAELFHPFYRSIVYRGDVVDGALALAMRWEEFPEQFINFGGPEVLSRIDFAVNLKHSVLPSLQYRMIEPNSEFFKNRPRVIAMTSQYFPSLLRRPVRTLPEAIQIEFS
jgi:dTDP-4-dehydrorhamnose reductase